jgi:molecular chaperone DnaJ
MQRDLYLALGVARTESSAGIRAAFRDLSKRYHPDRTGLGGADTFREIVDAYEVLSDPEARARYDATLRPHRCGSTSTNAIALRDGESIKPGLEQLFARIATNFTGLGIPKGERIEQLVIDVSISSEEAARGTTVQVGMPVFRRCSGCAGLGRSLFLRCALCLGEGLVEETHTMPIHIPPGIPDKSELLMPLARLGIHNFYACVRVSIA